MSDRLVEGEKMGEPISSPEKAKEAILARSDSLTDRLVAQDVRTADSPADGNGPRTGANPWSRGVQRYHRRRRLAILARRFRSFAAADPRVHGLLILLAVQRRAAVAALLGVRHGSAGLRLLATHAGPGMHNR